MRNIVLALGALAAIGFVAPLSSPAQAEKVVIKHGDRGLHRGWEHHHAKKVLIIRHGHHHERG